MKTYKINDNETLTVLRAQQLSLTDLKITYKLQNMQQEQLLSVVWTSMQADGQTTDVYYIDRQGVDSESENLVDRVLRADEIGEKDENPDLDLDLALRSSWEDVEYHEIENDIKLQDLEITDVNLYPYDIDNEEFSVDFAINDVAMLQLGTDGGFSIPSSDEASWNGSLQQDVFASNFSVDELVDHFKLSNDLTQIITDFIPSCAIASSDEEEKKYYKLFDSILD